MEEGSCETALPHYLATADETIKQIAATAQDSPLAPVRLSQQWEDGRANAPAQGEDTQVRKKETTERDCRLYVSMYCKVWCVVCGVCAALYSAVCCVAV